MQSKKHSKNSIIKLLIPLVIFLYSCNKQKNNTLAKNNKDQSKVEYSFKFPDTLIIGKKYKGIIEYKSKTDSVDTERYIYYLYGLFDKVQNIEVLKNKKLDTFVGVTKNKILIYNILFNKTGTYYIDGIVQDEYFIPSENKEEVILRKDESRVTHKVIVIDSLKTVIKKIPIVSDKI